MSLPDLLFKSIRCCFIRTAIEHGDGAINRFKVLYLYRTRCIREILGYKNICFYLDSRYCTLKNGLNVCKTIEVVRLLKNISDYVKFRLKGFLVNILG
jgi:hypothetical protein